MTIESLMFQKQNIDLHVAPSLSAEVILSQDKLLSSAPQSVNEGISIVNKLMRSIRGNAL